MIDVGSLEIGSGRFDVIVASTHEARQQGLSGRPSLGTGEAMVFVWPDEAPRRFHMRGMLFDLDILFFDRDGRLLNIVLDVTPCSSEPCPRYYSSGPSTHVVEVASGGAGRLGLHVGDTVAFPPDWIANASP